jgi:hypothetical protein
MRKIRLKFPITDFEGTLYEVGVNVQRHQEEDTDEKPLTKVCTFNAEPGEAEGAWRQHIQEAEAYATAVQAYPQLWASYKARAKKQAMHPRELAISDYLTGKTSLSK